MTISVYFSNQTIRKMPTLCITLSTPNHFSNMPAGKCAWIGASNWGSAEYKWIELPDQSGASGELLSNTHSNFAGTLSSLEGRKKFLLNPSASVSDVVPHVRKLCESNCTITQVKCEWRNDDPTIGNDHSFE